MYKTISIVLECSTHVLRKKIKLKVQSKALQSFKIEHDRFLSNYIKRTNPPIIIVE